MTSFLFGFLLVFIFNCLLSFKKYEEYWQLGLPVEVRDLDNKSARIFTSLLGEEGYRHFEARVMLAGEQETGKTTIAKYLTGQVPTKNRISTDGIELYNGLSFIDRETEEWMHGKQDFTLSEITISRSLRQSPETSTNDEIKCGTACPVMDNEFLKQIPTPINLRRLSLQYTINETKELAIYLGMSFNTCDDLFVVFGDQPDRLKFEMLRGCRDKSQITFNDIITAINNGDIQNKHTICKVVRGNPFKFNMNLEKWNLTPTEEHLDKLAPFVGNNSLAFLVELGMNFYTWEKIKFRQKGRDLVKLNHDILQEWKFVFCKENSMIPSLRLTGQAFDDIGNNVQFIENVLAGLF